MARNHFIHVPLFFYRLSLWVSIVCFKNISENGSGQVLVKFITNNFSQKYFSKVLKNPTVPCLIIKTIAWCFQSLSLYTKAMLVWQFCQVT
jgi:hypothetical protein